MHTNTIKKVAIWLGLTVLLFGGKLQAQIHGFDEKQIAFGYNYFNYTEYLLDDKGYEVSNPIGPASIDFKYGITDKVTSSWQLSYRSVETGEQPFIDELDFNKLKYNSYDVEIYTVLVRADINFKSDNYYRRTFYTSIGIGYNFANISKSEPNAPKLDVELDGIAWQINPLGYKSLITDNIGFFLEAGVGHNGFVSGGIFFRVWNYKIPRGHY
jgi:hypothetical protein